MSNTPRTDTAIAKAEQLQAEVDRLKSERLHDVHLLGAQSGELARMDVLIGKLQGALKKIVHYGWGAKPSFKEPDAVRRGRSVLSATPETAAAELAELWKDKERLDWLDDNMTYRGGGNGGVYSFSTPADVESGMLRAAIDAARASQQPKENFK